MSLIFKNIEEIKSVVPVPLSLKFDSLKPSIQIVQNTWLKKLLSPELLDHVVTMINGSSKLTDKEQELINLIRYPAAQIILRESADIINISITEGGFTVNQTESRGVASANRVVQLKEQLTINFQTGMNVVIDFLEANADDFTPYRTSSTRINRKKYFINNPEDFNKGLLGIHFNWFLLDAVKDVMATLEAQYILPALGPELFTDMKNKLSNSQSLGVYAPILPYIQRVIPGLVFHSCAETMNLRAGENGLYISTIKNSNEPQQTEVPGSLQAAANKHLKYAEERLAELSAHLIDNLQTYPLFANSTAYSNRSSDRIESNKKGVFYGTN